jgi:hypothetical protein
VSAQLGLPFAVVVLLSVLQSTIVLGFVSYAGLWAARRLEFGAPVLSGCLARTPAPVRRRDVGAASAQATPGVPLA